MNKHGIRQLVKYGIVFTGKNEENVRGECRMEMIETCILTDFSLLWEEMLIKETKKDMGKIIQTAGRDALGEFAPDFAHYNDDILFGENWNNTDIDLKTRCLITVVALMASGVTDSSLVYHLQNAKKNGVTKAEIAAAVTHVAFYAGWPKAWAVFNLAKEVWNEEQD